MEIVVEAKVVLLEAVMVEDKELAMEEVQEMVTITEQVHQVAMDLV